MVSRQATRVSVVGMCIWLRQRSDMHRHFGVLHFHSLTRSNPKENVIQGASF